MSEMWAITQQRNEIANPAIITDPQISSLPSHWLEQFLSGLRSRQTANRDSKFFRRNNDGDWLVARIGSDGKISGSSTHENDDAGDSFDTGLDNFNLIFVYFGHGSHHIISI
jgi:hypothetical protein